jgi:pimeloyl-ACP methyl ester carboxylesterase
VGRRLSIVAAVAAVAAVCCSVLAASAGAKVRALSPSQVSGIQWGPCTPGSDLDQLGAQCGTLSVPLDYNHPSRGNIQLAVSKLEHTSDAAHYQGAILTNPGGPGGSGLDLSAILALVLDQEGYSAAAADYDWIGFDPRGVGASQPSLTCNPNYFAGPRPNYTPSTRQLLSFWENTSDGYGRDCAKTSPAQYALLQNDTTIDTAKDMDSIRQALGQRQISYYGFSYGTYLGQVYSTLFPQNVRREILDSNVDPRGVWYQDNFTQDVAFQRNIEIWFGWLAKYNSVYNLGSTEAQVARTFNKAQNALAASPAGGEVGPDEWADIFLEAGYYEQTWEDLGSLFSEWINNPGPTSAADLVSAFKSTDGVGNDNGYAGYLAVQCTDTAWPNSWSKIVRDNWFVNAVAPFETWGNAWFNGPCTNWPGRPDRPVQINGSRTNSALLIDETLDAATPFPGSLEVRKLFPHASLIAEPGGTSHADSLFGDACVDGSIADYLTTGALPARQRFAPWDKTCAPLPQPDPTQQVSANAARAAKAGAGRAAQVARFTRATGGRLQLAAVLSR